MDSRQVDNIVTETYKRYRHGFKNDIASFIKDVMVNVDDPDSIDGQVLTRYATHTLISNLYLASMQAIVHETVMILKKRRECDK